MGRGVKRVEFLLAIVIAILLVGSLLSQQYFNLPSWLGSILILAFVVIKVVDITKGGGTVFEDYVSLSIIIVFGMIHFFLGNKINSVIIAVIVFVLIYSVGLIPWVDDLLKSRKVTSFIMSYAFFVLMIVFLFSGIYFAYHDQFMFNGEKTLLSFEDSLYFSTITFSSVGYGDISPLGVNKFIASVQAIIGIILNIAFIGYILASRRFRSG